MLTVSQNFQKQWRKKNKSRAKNHIFGIFFLDILRGLGKKNQKMSEENFDFFFFSDGKGMYTEIRMTMFISISRSL